jgi:hypothetical protein
MFFDATHNAFYVAVAFCVAPSSFETKLSKPSVQGSFPVSLFYGFTCFNTNLASFGYLYQQV